MKALICVRSLPKGTNTILFGREIARREGSSIVVMTVVGPREDESAAQAQISVAADLLRDEEGTAHVQTKVRRGVATEQILEEVAEKEYDVLVIGAHMVQRLWDFVFPSIASRVADDARLPVLVVRGRIGPVQRILVGVASTEPRRKVIRLVRRVAQATGAAVTLLYVAIPVPTMYTGLDAMEESLSDLLQTETPVAKHLRWSADYLSRHAVEAEVQLRHGTVVEEMLRELDARDYDLVVLGSKTGKAPFFRALSDSVTGRLIEQAPCPVLIVH